MCKSDLSKHRANADYMELSITDRQLLNLPEIPEIKQTIGSVKDATELTINKSWFIEFGGKVFIRDVNTTGETIYKDTKNAGLLDITDDGVRSFYDKYYRIYTHKNGNQNYIHNEEGLFLNEKNDFPNGVKKILTTIDHDIEGRLLEFKFIDNGIERTHYLNETGKILDESFNRLDGSDPFLEKALNAIALIPDQDESGIYSFNSKSYELYNHENGNQNYIDNKGGLLFNDKNGFPNGVKTILKTINHEIEEELLKFTFIDNGIERTHYLNETGKILDESFNRLDDSNPLLDKLFKKRKKEGDTSFIYKT